MPWYTLVLALWLVTAVVLNYRLKYKIFEFLWCILQSIPILSWMTQPIIALVLFPWVFLHELCHALMGKMSGNSVHKISVYPEEVILDGVPGIRLGYTKASGGNRIFDGFFQLAPLLLGNLAVALLLNFGFGIPWLHMLDYPQTVFGAFLETVRAIVARRSFALVFLLWAFGNGAIPSQPDWRLSSILWTTTTSVLLITLSVIAAVGFDAVADPYYTIKLLAVLTMLAIQLTIVLLLNLLTYTILLFPGKRAVARYAMGK